MQNEHDLSKAPGFLGQNAEDFSMMQILGPYDQMFFPDPFGLEASMQFPSQL
jgi:hypothetical protein